MWYYVDLKERIEGSNVNDMGGNSGWVNIDAVIDNLTNINGVPSYKYVDGKIVERTQVEIDGEIIAWTERLPSPDTRVADIDGSANGALVYGESIEEEF